MSIQNILETNGTKKKLYNTKLIFVQTVVFDGQNDKHAIKGLCQKKM